MGHKFTPALRADRPVGLALLQMLAGHVTGKALPAFSTSQY